MATEKDENFRIKGGVCHATDGRHYAFIRVWDNDRAEGEPVREMRMPKGGLATREEAEEYYHERVRPEVSAILGRAEDVAGGTIMPIKRELLH